MPIRKSREEIVKYWIMKTTNPEVMKQRFMDVKNLQEEGMIKVGELLLPVNDIIRNLLDAHGISGSRRLDYYNFGRKIWRALYGSKGQIHGKMIEAVKLYFKTAFDLSDELMDKIADEIMKFVNEINERSIKEGEMALYESGGVKDGGSEDGDSGSG